MGYDHFFQGPSHNYCRNPHAEAHPWCFISPMEMEYCDIPVCSNTNAKRKKSLTQCKINQYQCKTGECIPATWICDGTKVCK